MSIVCPSFAFVASICLVASAAARADCAAEVLAYEAAKGSFPADVEAIYHVTLPELNLASAESGDDLLAENLVVGEIDFSVLSESSRQSLNLTADLRQMVSALDEVVNPLFLKRRQMPQVFAKGADLSRCLSRLQLAEYYPILAVFSAKAAANEVRETECMETKAGSAETRTEQAEFDAKITKLDNEIDQSDDPATKEALTMVIGLEATAFVVDDLVDAKDCMFTDNEFLPESMAIAFSLIMTVVPSMRDRQFVQGDLVRVFGEELDFGYFDMSEETE